MYIDYQSRQIKSSSNHEDSIELNENTNKHSIYVRVLKCSSILFLCLSTGLGYSVYQHYQKSLDWSTNRDSLKMANMPIDTLTDTGKQLKHKENFLVLYNKMYHHDGTISANQTQIKQLQAELKKIKRGKPIYQAKFNRINEKYIMTVKLDSVFANKEHTIIKKKMTPNKIRYILKTDLAPHLNSLHEKNSHDHFVSNQLKEIHQLYRDSNLILQITDRTLRISQINPKKKRIMFNDNVITATYNDIIAKYNKLHYKWRFLNSYLAMNSDIQNILSEQEDKINAYNDYMSDQKDKQNAYLDLEKQHKARQKAYEDKIREKEEERKEKLEQEKQAREARKESDENDSSSDNSYGKHDNSKSENSQSSNSNKTEARPHINNSSSSNATGHVAHSSQNNFANKASETPNNRKKQVPIKKSNSNKQASTNKADYNDTDDSDDNEESKPVTKHIEINGERSDE